MYLQKKKEKIFDYLSISVKACVTLLTIYILDHMIVHFSNGIKLFPLKKIQTNFVIDLLIQFFPAICLNNVSVFFLFSFLPRQKERKKERESVRERECERERVREKKRE